MKPKPWWVNQGASYKQERDGGYLWAPRETARGQALGHWTNLTRLKVGDTVFHYANKSIMAASRVLETAIESSRPPELPEASWGSEGFLVRAEYQELREPLSIGAIPIEWRTPDAGAFTVNGTVKQVYLVPLADEFVWRLLGRFAAMLPEFVRTLPSTWCIYVPRSAAENFGIARSQQIWGTVDRENFEGIEEGDSLLLVHDIATDLSPPPRGFPRVELPKFRGTARLLVTGEVTTKPFEDDAYVWPDKTYPFRFRFEEKAAKENVAFNDEVFPSAVVDAIRRSAIQQGRPMLVHEYVEGTYDGSSKGDEELLERGPLNIILYGPPGTGKTYSVRRRALKIVAPASVDLPASEISKLYRQYLEQGRIEFVTFHPSYSYEEFVEGYRYDDAKGIPTLHEGVFRRLVDRAVNPYQKPASVEGARVWKVSLGKPSEPWLVERCVANGEIAIGWFDDQDLADYDRTGIAGLFGGGAGGPTPVNSINSVNYLVNEIQEGDYVAVFLSQREIQAIGVVTGDYEYHKEYERHRHTRPVEWLDRGVHDIYEMNGSKNLTRSTIYPLDRISLQDFVELLPSEEKTEEPCVLIIDEINRGNVSRIFGELITLLEEDKRRGAPNEFSVRLPYSRRSFTVPSNLYLIGTMNTADRSIALIDVALRRRFEFEEIMPDVGVVRRSLLAAVEEDPAAQFGPELVELVCRMFEVLNRRITVLLDRDHQIGHSYFLGATSMERLHQALYRKVFPLLQEYFYNDREKLRLLLGAYDAGAKKGFVASIGSEYGAIFGEEVLDDETPWEFHRYGVVELEEALRNTFLYA